jgi:hypothetical protein
MQALSLAPDRTKTLSPNSGMCHKIRSCAAARRPEFDDRLQLHKKTDRPFNRESRAGSDRSPRGQGTRINRHGAETIRRCGTQENASRWRLFCPIPQPSISGRPALPNPAAGHQPYLRSCRSRERLPVFSLRLLTAASLTHKSAGTLRDRRLCSVIVSACGNYRGQSPKDQSKDFCLFVLTGNVRLRPARPLPISSLPTGTALSCLTFGP